MKVLRCITTTKTATLTTATTIHDHDADDEHEDNGDDNVNDGREHVGFFITTSVILNGTACTLHREGSQMLKHFMNLH